MTREQVTEAIRSSVLGPTLRAEAMSRLNSGRESPNEIIIWLRDKEIEAIDGEAETHGNFQRPANRSGVKGYQRR